jgi:SAM-dependent methyltransferase
MDDFKQAQREMWSAGDYGELSPMLAEVGELLVSRAGVGEGERVLDVACGTGTVALPAARAGAQVSALDLSPKLVAEGRERAEAEGLEIEWVEGDAEALPFDDDSFDRVLSTFGHMFAPRHRRTAKEMARVCRRGGVIGFCAWTPEGTVGDMFAISAEYAPPPPDYAMPPLLWGNPEHVREMLGSAGRDFACERHEVVVEWDSLEGFADTFMAKFPPMAAAQTNLGERFGELRERTIEFWRRENLASDGSFRFSQEYLLSIVEL